MTWLTTLCVVVLFASVSAHCTSIVRGGSGCGCGFFWAGALHCLLAAWLPGHRLLVRLRSGLRRRLTSIQLSGSLPSSLGSLKITTLCVAVLSASASSCGTVFVRSIAVHGVSFLQVHYSSVSLMRGWPGHH